MAKKNIELLKRLRTRFLRMRHSEHFDMETLASKTECGTAMCIAGHALELGGVKRRRNSHRDEFEWFYPNGRRVDNPIATAQRLLGLTYAEARTRSGLFYRYELDTPREAAKALADIIQDPSKESL